MSVVLRPYRKLAIELFAGLHGWGSGLTAAGFRVVGFDLVDMPSLLNHPVPEHCSLVLQDVLTLHGSQFPDASLIVASPPCQEFSFRAQPWKIGKAQHPESLGLPVPAWWKLPEPKMSPEEFAEWSEWKRKYPAVPPNTALFDACFRIQREASEAAGRYIPLVVENVRGAQPWVGRAKWSYGPFYLWGDVPALMPRTLAVKQHGSGAAWFDHGIASLPSSSPRRRAASALIAKIPFELALHVGRVYYPHAEERAS